MREIGIFWIINGKVDSFKEPVESGKNCGDTVQPSCDHFIYWDEFTLRHPQLRLFGV